MVFVFSHLLETCPSLIYFFLLRHSSECRPAQSILPRMFSVPRIAESCVSATPAAPLSQSHTTTSNLANFIPSFRRIAGSDILIFFLKRLPKIRSPPVGSRPYGKLFYSLICTEPERVIKGSTSLGTWWNVRVLPGSSRRMINSIICTTSVFSL